MSNKNVNLNNIELSAFGQGSLTAKKENFDDDNSIPKPAIADNKKSFIKSYHSRRNLLALILVESLAAVVFFLKYDILVINHRLLGSCLLGSITSILGQTIDQFFKSNFSANKFFKFLLWGAINGLFSELWIDFIFVNARENNVKKILMDQIIGNPTFQLVFIIFSCIWDNNDIKLALRTSYIKTLKLSFFIWPSFSILAFTILPENLVFPMNCILSLIWNVILSSIG
ncbi:hypothetical protein PACTADRAFT_15555 [Pachysolen tannophilus NRRL Y-2460]|uniref:Uncharacterized protein n=1 Tax=Pachysolen tannophilus NRRL Y-2460 TaxID=669874 RepID=A0A1E4TZ86_PACTA|nr:hypothetical protein PACTADRAFT_15555 [Pachysolen tannophilus NRRL Y-2460]